MHYILACYTVKSGVKSSIKGAMLLMEVAPLPPDEQERLMAVESYEILDSAAESIFDNITWLAAHLCQVSSSYISIIASDRQWFKSTSGKLELTQTPRDIAFCSHTILDNKLLEITDATQDKRFFDNPLVLDEPKIRFYAGMPLTNPNGYNLGTLCVIDHHPKNLTNDQREALKRLSEIVVKLFEDRKVMFTELRKHQLTEDTLKITNTNFEHRLEELRQRNKVISLLSEMSGILLSCINAEEVYQIVTNYCKQLFPMATGSLYILNQSHNYVESVSEWGESQFKETIFTPEKCWALRRGQIYQVNDARSSPVCGHLLKYKSAIFPYLCTPIMAQSEILGVLCLEFHSHDITNATYTITETERTIATALSEQIGSTLANIKLREVLHQQSISDPLTNLYSRNFIEVAIEHEIARTKRNHSTISILMITIDNFKELNENYGHDAADAVLRELADILLKHFRKSDIASRITGEQFILLLPETPLKVAYQRADELRITIANTKFYKSEKLLGKISVSIGVAVSKTHGNNSSALLLAASKALHKAQNAGGNQVCIL